MKSILLNFTKKIINNNKFEKIKKGISSDKVCYIIGNGPSLKYQDLSKLDNSYNMACNNFIKYGNIQDLTVDFYCISDPSFINKEGYFETPLEIEKLRYYNSNMIKVYPIRFLFNPNFIMNKLYKNTVFIKIDKEKKIWEYENINFDLTKNLFWGHTIILDICIPLAVFLGFKEIRLLGCDTNYNKENTHFYKSISTDEYHKNAKTNRSIWYEIVNKGYSVASKLALKQSIDIYDCTYEGSIEALKKKRLK